MSEHLKCGVVRDLLPLYVEDLVSPETREEIDAHLAGCEECRAQLNQATAQVPVASQVNLNESAPLKRVYLWLILLIVGSPVWFPLLLAAAVVALSLLFTLWVVILALWCVPLSLAAAVPAAALQWILLMTRGAWGNPLIYLGGALCCAGLAVLSGWGCWYLTKWAGRLTRYLGRRIAAIWKEKSK